MKKFEVGCANQIIDVDSNLHVLKKTLNTSELAKKKLVKKILLIFRHYK
jgi:hypothetical protein